jgi:hypothetical protein
VPTVTASAHLTFEKCSKTDSETGPARIDKVVVAGWTGRDQDALTEHIRELEALGVAAPKTTPIFYRVAAALLTNDDEIQVSGDESSGEVEFVIFNLEDGLWVGLGSDHTDRKAESINVSLSKQMCHTPVAGAVWRFDDVADHWDDLILRSWAIENGQRSLYQEGSVTTMRHPDDLFERYGGLAPHCAMFGGTLAAEGGIRPADAFEMELEDPILGRKINHRYAVTRLPVEG